MLLSLGNETLPSLLLRLLGSSKIYFVNRILIHIAISIHFPDTALLLSRIIDHFPIFVEFFIIVQIDG